MSSPWPWELCQQPQKHFICNGYKLLVFQALKLQPHTKLSKYEVYTIAKVVTEVKPPNFSWKCTYFYNYIPIDWLAVVNSPCIPFSSRVLWSSLWHADSTVLGSSTSLSIWFSFLKALLPLQGLLLQHEDSLSSVSVFGSIKAVLYFLVNIFFAVDLEGEFCASNSFGKGDGVLLSPSEEEDFICVVAFSW